MKLNQLIAAALAVHVFAGGTALQAADSSFTLVSDGTPQAVIVTGPDPGEKIRSAAKELQEYIEKSTGAKLPIESESKSGRAIHVGETPLVKEHGIQPSDLDQDGFILRGLDDGNYAIVGGSSLGTEFGVYEFLERYLSVRWLLPGTLGEDVPKAKTLTVPVAEVRQEPVFLSRDFTKSNSEGEQLWAKRSRINRRVDNGHAMVHLLPVTEFGESHPEFYPLINGKRVIPAKRNPKAEISRDKKAHRMWQPNFTAPGIVDAIAGKLGQFFDENPEAQTHRLGLNDSNEYFDQSPESLKHRSGKKNSGGYLDASDEYFPFANAIVAKVLGKYPDKWFGTSAYRSLYDPPTHSGVHERLVVYLTYDRLRWADPKLKEFDEGRTLAWLKAAPKTTGWSDYTYGMHYPIPRVYPHLMGEYLRWGADHGVRFYTGEQNPNWGEGPKAWLLTKLIWNPHQDVDALLNEWYERAAGKAAAPKLKDYYEIWEKFWTQDVPKGTWWHGKSPYLSLGSFSYLADVPLEYVDRADRLLSEALELASTPEQKVRVANLKEMWDTWYRPQIFLYRLPENTVYVPQTENDALKALADAEKNIAMARDFKETTTKWQTDEKYLSNPFFEHFGRRFKIPKPAPPDYGDACFLLWQLRPWVIKSEKVRQRLEHLAQTGDPVVRDNVCALLAAVDEKGTSLLKNASFEQGEEGWDLRVETRPFPSDYPFPDYNGEIKGTFAISENTVRSGKRSLQVSADRVPKTVDIRSPARIMQTIPYKPGAYYTTASYYLAPETAPGAFRKIASLARFNFDIQVLDEDGKVLPGIALPSWNIRPAPGRWGTNYTAFTLPPNEKAKNLRVALKLEMMTIGWDFDPALKMFIDDLDVVKVDD